MNWQIKPFSSLDSENLALNGNEFLFFLWGHSGNGHNAVFPRASWDPAQDPEDCPIWSPIVSSFTLFF